MTDNPLVAKEEDSTEWYSGSGIAESISDLVKGIESGNWADIGLGALTTGLEALSFVIDPIGSVGSNLVGFIIEHVAPLREALDDLAGNADAVAAQAQTWQNVGKAVAQVKSDYERDAATDTAAWAGKAGDAYRRRAADTAALIGAAAEASNGIGSAVRMAGMLVAVVRETVRDLIADLVGRLVVWAAEALTVVGAPAAAAQAATAAAKWAARIAQIIKNLVRALQNLIPMLRKLGELLKQIRKKMDDLSGKSGGGGQPPKKPNDPPGTGGHPDHTQPSGKPDPDATPDGHPTRIPDRESPENKRALELENESATTLAKAGYKVEQNPSVPGDKNPDYRIEGEVFDNVAPTTSNPRNVADRIQRKVDAGQTERVVVNLADSNVSVDAMRAQLRDWPIEGLKEVIVIDKNGNVLHIYP
ncbi:hypothetical protein [Lentzea flava]|uniref:tRNA nuclease CdiA C-terminal domain-containing protein n=1 Tax=Lentzea flava TaxID=103732 RepID=A0ABQ2V303_9PSEU|nr:hypothetical protein [Lentzea flava]MCP2203236.1 hypothetical protein [Lentzea flava]GGU66655.1 hypothetical protein GCM10010178_68130 [Lentzea flava]